MVTKPHAIINQSHDPQSYPGQTNTKLMKVIIPFPNRITGVSLSPIECREHVIIGQVFQPLGGW